MNPKEILEKVNEAISRKAYPTQPEGLYEPIKYVLSLGGKRIRPVFMLLAYRLYKENIDYIMTAAIGLEMYHNFTLLHDDLMDKADIRRGKPTVHKKWDANTAILSGDSMMMMAAKMIHSVDSPNNWEATDLFCKTALEIGEGQQYDMNFEQRDDVLLDEYMEMIRLKTSVLLACAFKMGAIYGGANEKDSDLLYRFGEKIGLAFQLQDDYLDVYGNPLTFGKRIGGDILCNKKTFLLINALNLADAETKNRLERLLCATEIQPEEKIKAVTDIYNQLEIGALCRQKETSLFEEARQLLSEVSVCPEKRDELWQFVENLRNRNV